MDSVFTDLLLDNYDDLVNLYGKDAVQKYVGKKGWFSGFTWAEGAAADETHELLDMLRHRLNPTFVRNIVDTYIEEGNRLKDTYERDVNRMKLWQRFYDSYEAIHNKNRRGGREREEQSVMKFTGWHE